MYMRMCFYVCVLVCYHIAMYGVMWIIDYTGPAGQPSSSAAKEVNTKDEIAGKRNYTYM